MAEHKVATLATLNQGTVSELFAESWKKVMENIADENTPPTKERVIIIKITVKPNEEREYATTKISTSVSLAPVKPSESVVLFSFDGRGVTAYVNDPRQEELPLEGVKVSTFRQAGAQ